MFAWVRNMAANIDGVSVRVIDLEKEGLRKLSEEIWSNPELNYEEHTAHKLLTDYLEKKGFTVDRGYCELPTAFRATYGSGRPNVCIICEYDALPNIGHACGHNLIAEAGVAAGIGVKAFIESKGAGFTGTVTVMGTPAEEGGGGKVLMIERGAFNGIDIAIMAHPAPYEIIMPNHLACAQMNIEFSGKAAHAAAFPWEGVNALDAAVLGYTNISALRQQMKPTWRVHGVFTNGGVKPNIIPEQSALQYYIRAPSVEELGQLKEKVTACFEGAAQATGCTVQVTDCGKLYHNVVCNPVLGRLYERNYSALGVSDYQFEGDLTSSTDFGNVSQIVPGIHPRYKVGNGVATHSAPFADIANLPSSHDKTIIVAKALSLTAVDVLIGGEELLRRIWAEFRSTVK